MPSEEDLERLRAMAQEPDEASERPSAVGPHVSVHVHQHEKKEAAKHTLHKIAESGWAKSVLVLVLGGAAGAGGSETHRVIAAAGLVTKAELEEHKKEMVRELGKEDAKIDLLRTDLGKVRDIATLSRLESRALGVYLYGVLPKLGVEVKLQEGVGAPPKMEFHAPPLSLSVGPNAAKPIQPRSVFPLPLAADPDP